MNIIFEKLRFKNFLSYGNTFEELDLSGNRKILVAGLVGSGKSTFTEALTFVLFGKAYRNINIPQLPNSINKKDCVVELEFLSNKRKIHVKRGLNPSFFEIWVNGRLLDQTGKLEYQDTFEKEYLGMNYTAFSQIVLIGKTSFEPFMKLSKGKRREMVEYILGLTIISKMTEILKADIARIKEEQTRLSQEKTRLEDKKYFQEKLLQQYKENTNFHEGDHFQQIQDIEKDIQEKDVEIVLSRNELESLNKQIEQMYPYETSFLDKRQLLEKAKRKKTELSARLIELSRKTHFCPSCGYDLNQEQRAEHEENLKNILSVIDKKIPQLGQELSELAEKANEISELRHQKNTLNVGINSCYSIIQDKRLLLSRIKQKYKDWKQTSQNDEKNLIKDIDQTTKELADTLEQIRKKEKEREQIELSELALKDEGIKSEIINKYIPLFNVKIREYLYSLDFFVDFRLDEQFNGRIFSLSKKEFSYYSFSEGEKLKIDIAVMLAWRDVCQHRNSMSTNLLIFDETFDSSLDVNDIDSSLSLFRSFSDTTLIVISHVPEKFLNSFDIIKKVKKQGNFSVTQNFPVSEVSNQIADLKLWLTE